jgi:hypothetical protein
MVENGPGFTPEEIKNNQLAQEKPVLDPMAYYDTSLQALEGREETVAYIPGDFKLEDSKNPATEYIATALINAPSYLALSGTAVAGGLLGVAANPLAHVDSKVAALALGASYAIWFKAVHSNAKEAWNLLENSEICTSLAAKTLYEFSKKHTQNEKIQKIATYTGFVFWTAVEEVPWIISAVVVPDIVDEYSPAQTLNNEFSYLAGANLGAAAFNLVQAGGVHEINESLEAKENILNRAKNRVGKLINRR